MSELPQQLWWAFVVPLALIAIFYWPGRVVLRVLSKGRYPPAGGRRHDIELVALVGLALFLLVLSVVFG